MHVTVAICTWNRADLLDQTLTRMRELRVPKGVEWELLVVNNNCTDHTDNVIAKHVSHLPIRKLFETKQGHSHARNCALEHASGDWILWTDDDVLVEKEWLTAFSGTAERHPEATAIGGPIEPWFPRAPEPELLQAFPILRGGYCGIDHGAEERPLADDEPIWGANMAYRRAAVGGLRFDPQLGRVRDMLTSGDDYDYLVRVRALGSPVYWSPGMRLRHYVEPERMTLNYLCRFYEGHGRTCVLGDNGVAGRRLFGVPLWVARLLCENWLGYYWNRLRKRRIPALVQLRDYHRLRGMFAACRERARLDRDVPSSCSSD